MTCRISCFQDGGSFQLNHLVKTCRLKSSSRYERIKNKQVTVFLSNQKERKRYTLIYTTHTGIKLQYFLPGASWLLITSSQLCYWLLITSSQLGYWLLITRSQLGYWLLITNSQLGYWLLITSSHLGYWLLITRCHLGYWLNY